MSLRAALVAIAMVVSAGAHAHGDPAVEDAFVELESPHSVSVTIDRLAAAVETAGATIFARIDHAAGAGSIDQTLRPNQVLIFGNPALGTPLMAADPAIGLDLPIKVLAYESADGQVLVRYLSADALKARYGIEGRDEVFSRMEGALMSLTGAAIAPAE